MSTLRDLYTLLGNKYTSKTASQREVDAFFKRPLVCTPLLANYEAISGWVVCVTGSPPKGTLILMENRTPFYLDAIATKSKQVAGEKQCAVIKRFYKEFLSGKDKPFTISLSEEK